MNALALRTRRNFRCRCGRPVFFRNSTCLACGAPLGWVPGQGLLLTLERAPSGEDDGPPRWRSSDSSSAPGSTFRRCDNLDSAAACNWLIEEDDTLAENFVGAGGNALCVCCRLTRTLPDLSLPGNDRRWLLIETAKRRLVSSLLGLGLPVQPKSADDHSPGLAFDLLQSLPAGPAVSTGHEGGVVTLDIEESDDAVREQRRALLREPYRTLLGHLRHEVGHYHWHRLIEHTRWHGPFRALFGDERADYASALQRHYRQGPPPDWAQAHLSAYAASHPWEDWAETWAHYLHIVETLDTAHSFGLDGAQIDLDLDRYDSETIGADAGADDEPDAADGNELIAMLNSWIALIAVLNELSRSMGAPDFYPFVLSIQAVRKLQFVHRVVAAQARGADSDAPTPDTAADDELSSPADADSATTTPR